MTRPTMKRTVLSGVMLALTTLSACTHTPIAYLPKDQPTIDRKFVDYPAGFELKLVMSNLTAPTSITHWHQDANSERWILESSNDCRHL